MMWLSGLRSLGSAQCHRDTIPSICLIDEREVGCPIAAEVSGERLHTRTCRQTCKVGSRRVRHCEAARNRKRFWHSGPPGSLVDECQIVYAIAIKVTGKRG